MPAIYHEGSWLGNATDPEVLIKDTVGWSGKNKCETIPAFTLVKGSERTKNNTIKDTPDYGTYKVSFTISNVANITKQGGIQIGDSAGNWSKSTDGVFDVVNGRVLLTIPFAHAVARVYVYLNGNDGDTATATFSDFMITDADILDDTYEPYHESVEEEIEQIYADNGVLGAKNFLNPTYAGGTINGVTITANDNKTYKLNGAPSSGNMAVAIYTGTFPAGRYILNGVPDFTTYGARLHIRETAGASQVDATDTGKGIEFTIPSATTSYSVFMYLNSGYTANNLIIKPMIRLASDPDDTYQPYAMTNRELTEKKINIADLKTVVSASSDFADFKTRIASL